MLTNVLSTFPEKQGAFFPACKNISKFVVRVELMSSEKKLLCRSSVVHKSDMKCYDYQTIVRKRCFSLIHNVECSVCQ